MNVASCDALPRLLQAIGAMQERIAAEIPADLTVWSDKAESEVTPADGKLHDKAMKLLRSTVTKIESIATLTTLYLHQTMYVDDYNGFMSQYGRLWTPERQQKIRYFYPKLDQTTISEILQPMTKTAVCTCLDSFCLIGLLNRSPMTAPDHKFVWISEAGVRLMEEMGDNILKTLSPLFSINVRTALEAVRPDLADRLDTLAKTRSITMEEMLLEAIDDCFAKYDDGDRPKPPKGQSRRRPKAPPSN